MRTRFMQQEVLAVSQDAGGGGLFVSYRDRLYLSPTQSTPTRSAMTTPATKNGLNGKSVTTETMPDKPLFPMADDDRTLLRLINERVGTIQEQIVEFKDSLKDDYVTNDRFKPIERLVYGLVGTVMIAFILTLIYVIGWKV